jgi:hypothetical protein
MGVGCHLSSYASYTAGYRAVTTDSMYVTTIREHYLGSLLLLVALNTQRPDN